MKRLRKITAADENTSGTTFYIVTKDQIENNISPKNNIWIKYRLRDYPLEESLNLDYLDGSRVIDDILYYCDTNYEEITVNGEQVNPEEALFQYSLEDLATYISEDTPNSVLKTFTENEISWKDIDISEFAKELLETDSLEDVARDAESIGLINI